MKEGKKKTERGEAAAPPSLQKKRKTVVKLNLKCSEEDKQVGQSREEEK